MDGSSISSSTSDGSLYHIYYAKNMLFQSHSPRILTINAYILLSMLLAFVVVSVYNLSQFLLKYSDIQGRIQIYYYIAERNMEMRAGILELKVMQ